MAHRLAHEGGVGVIDDGRQRAVVVEEHDDLLPLGRRHDLLELTQRRRVPRLRKLFVSARHVRIVKQEEK